MDGRALALGPDVDGDAITPFGGNAVAGGEFLRNQRYGIECSVAMARVSKARPSGELGRPGGQ